MLRTAASKPAMTCNIYYCLPLTFKNKKQPQQTTSKSFFQYPLTLLDYKYKKDYTYNPWDVLSKTTMESWSSRLITKPQNNFPSHIFVCAKPTSDHYQPRHPPKDACMRLQRNHFWNYYYRGKKSPQEPIWRQQHHHHDDDNKECSYNPNPNESSLTPLTKESLTIKVSR